MNDSPRDPFAHAGACQVCPACGMPELPGVSCLCFEPTSPSDCCASCGCDAGDYEATCPECRLMGRVELSLARFLDRVLEQLHRSPAALVRTELLPEEPLPTTEPPQRRSWRPTAA